VDFNLKELVQSLYQSFSLEAREKRIIFDVEYDAEMPFYVKGDSLRISQVLNNLISNAMKFTDHGSVRLKIQCVEDNGTTIKTRFSVHDTGIGIAREKQDKIFEQFTQADSDTTRLFGGTGLGLSISSRLVELMNGRIRVESIPNKGSEFYFTIDLQCSHADRQAVTEQKKTGDPALSFQGKKILLAEDNPFNANIARRFLTVWGAELDVALDGQQALEFALRKDYDLILMDVQMPVMDGFSCSRAIRKYQPHIPIIAVTASPLNEVQGEIHDCGMNDFVSKPFKPSELHGKMEKYLVA
jgi:CheY-like chemotaxis protein